MIFPVESVPVDIFHFFIRFSMFLATSSLLLYYKIFGYFVPNCRCSDVRMFHYRIQPCSTSIIHTSTSQYLVLFSALNFSSSLNCFPTASSAFRSSWVVCFPLFCPHIFPHSDRYLINFAIIAECAIFIKSPYSSSTQSDMVPGHLHWKVYSLRSYPLVLLFFPSILVRFHEFFSYVCLRQLIFK